MGRSITDQSYYIGYDYIVKRNIGIQMVADNSVSHGFLCNVGNGELFTGSLRYLVLLMWAKIFS